MHLGEFSSALTHTERGIELYNPREHRQYAFLYGGHDPGVCGLRHAAMILYLLGYPDQALQKSQDALALAQKLSHPNSLAFALYYSAWVHQQRGEMQAVNERSRRPLHWRRIRVSALVAARGSSARVAAGPAGERAGGNSTDPSWFGGGHGCRTRMVLPY